MIKLKGGLVLPSRVSAQIDYDLFYEVNMNMPVKTIQSLILTEIRVAVFNLTSGNLYEGI